ncbi:glycosyltransferase [Winogradskyella sp. UBA3174]|uniref:glycosyltransferase n=1 Tax=Winogradskyella sp. UBA3174 TaxID=1947785 RepID=UPI0025CF02C3|nr:glycosyltransferase [Winogradskyella sp. UBA3174]|tara:strand:+ start:64999 stop:66075 length:1077 start_codon:yes stop_codon:yes gene_type:complete
MPRLLFVCPDIQQPSGGIKQIYRQVDVLNKNNFEAYILHENSGFKCNWFANTTPVVYNSSLFKALANLKLKADLSSKQKLKSLVKQSIKKAKNSGVKGEVIEILESDILVFPEVYGPKLAEVKPGIKKVIYNQGAYQTFFGYDLDLKDTHTPYHHKDLISVIVNSEDAKQYMNLAFPKLNIYRVKYGFDSNKFSIKTTKKKQISFMPRRLRSDIVQVINILKFKGVLDGWNIKLIENMSEQQVADCMKESTIFLSFNINEGFGMPPAEAMACGCIVAGYPGQGGTEIFNTDFSFPVKDRDIKAYVKTLDNLIKAYEENPEPFNIMTKKASEFILSEYSMEEEERTIIEAWSNVLKLKA